MHRSEKTSAAFLPSYENNCAKIKALCEKYPFLSQQSIGKSVLGRSITALKTGDCDDPVLYVGGFHGSEWITTTLLLRFVEELCAALYLGKTIAGVDCRRAMLGRGIYIIPCLNPDGVEISLNGSKSAMELESEVERISAGDTIHWKANARGVDLNRNFDAGWHISRQLEIALGINSPASRRYGGEKPFSEPETAALASLCETIDFRHVLAFHSQGEEIYWKYGSATPKKAALMARVFAASSGYELREPEKIASHAGFKDWFIEKFSRPGFTIEVGRGENPLPLCSLDDIYSSLEEMLLLGIVI